MQLTREEGITVTVLGALALVGLGVLLWQRQQPPLVISGSPASAEAAQWDRALDAARRVDVNTADAAALERLPEIGPALARRIVEYRNAHGWFQTLEELSRVPGIGPHTLESIQPYITTSER